MTNCCFNVLCTHGESPHSVYAMHPQGTRNRARWSPAASSARDPQQLQRWQIFDPVDEELVDLSEIFMLNIVECINYYINQASVREKNWVLHFVSTWLCFGFGHWRHLVLERFIACSPNQKTVTSWVDPVDLHCDNLLPKNDLFSVFQLNLYL